MEQVRMWTFSYKQIFEKLDEEMEIQAQVII